LEKNVCYTSTEASDEKCGVFFSTRLPSCNGSKQLVKRHETPGMPTLGVRVCERIHLGTHQILRFLPRCGRHGSFSSARRCDQRIWTKSGVPSYKKEQETFKRAVAGIPIGPGGRPVRTKTFQSLPRRLLTSRDIVFPARSYLQAPKLRFQHKFCR
jgi:hypothetical protein